MEWFEGGESKYSGIDDGGGGLDDAHGGGGGCDQPLRNGDSSRCSLLTVEYTLRCFFNFSGDSGAGVANAGAEEGERSSRLGETMTGVMENSEMGAGIGKACSTAIGEGGTRSSGNGTGCPPSGNINAGVAAIDESGGAGLNKVGTIGTGVAVAGASGGPWASPTFISAPTSHSGLIDNSPPSGKAGLLLADIVDGGVAGRVRGGLDKVGTGVAVAGASGGSWASPASILASSSHSGSIGNSPSGKAGLLLANAGTTTVDTDVGGAGSSRVRALDKVGIGPGLAITDSSGTGGSQASPASISASNSNSGSISISSSDDNPPPLRQCLTLAFFKTWDYSVSYYFRCFNGLNTY